MRPDAEAPCRIADEVGVELRDAAVVDHLLPAGVTHPRNRQPLPIMRTQPIAGLQIPRRCPALTSCICSIVTAWPPAGSHRAGSCPELCA